MYAWLKTFYIKKISVEGRHRWKSNDSKRRRGRPSFAKNCFDYMMKQPPIVLPDGKGTLYRVFCRHNAMLRLLCGGTLGWVALQKGRFLRSDIAPRTLKC